MIGLFMLCSIVSFLRERGFIYILHRLLFLLLEHEPQFRDHQTSRKELLFMKKRRGLVRNRDVFFGFVLEPMWIQSVLGCAAVVLLFS